MTNSIMTGNRLRGAASLASVLALAGIAPLTACAQTAGEDGVAVTAAEKPITMLADDASLQWGPCPPVFAEGCELTVLNGDPAKPNADLLLRTPGNGFVLAPHTHTSVERMILLTGELLVHYMGNEPAVLQAGEYAFGPAALPHEATCQSDGPCVLFIAFEQPVDAIPYDGEIE